MWFLHSYLNNTLNLILGVLSIHYIDKIIHEGIGHLYRIILFISKIGVDNELNGSISNVNHYLNYPSHHGSQRMMIFRNSYSFLN